MKGGSFEREVCELLSKWWSNNERDDIFGRSDGSGSRFTARKKSGKNTANQAGDITFTDSIGEPLIKAWNIECKTGYGGREKIKNSSGEIIKKIQHRWDLLDLIDSIQKQTVFESMCEQCHRDASLSGREPILIFRRNQRKVCVAISRRYINILSDFYGQPICKSIEYDCKEDIPIVIFQLRDFLEWIHDPKIYFR